MCSLLFSAAVLIVTLNSPRSAWQDELSPGLRNPSCFSGVMIAAKPERKKLDSPAEQLKAIDEGLRIHEVIERHKRVESRIGR